MPAPFRLPPLDAAARQAVADHYERTDEPEERTRCQVVLLAQDFGLTAPQIGPLVRRSADTVLRVLQRFDAAGLAGVPSQYRPGGQAKVTPGWLAELQRVIDLDPHTAGVRSANWTTGLLATYLGQTTGITVDAETVRRHLHGLDDVCKRPTWTLADQARSREDWEGNACGWRSS